MTDHAHRLPPSLDALAVKIREKGWMVAYIAPHLGQERTPYAYTIGLTEAGLPELAIAGLPAVLSHEILQTAARNTLATEVRDGDVVTDACSVPLQVKAIPNRSAVFARRLYGVARVSLLQLVWPDSAGAFPDDPGWKSGAVQDIPAP